MLDSEPSVGLIYAWSAVIDEQGRKLTGDFRVSPIEGDVYETLLGHNFIGNASACLIRRDCLKRLGIITPNFLSSMRKAVKTGIFIYELLKTTNSELSRNF